MEAIDRVNPGIDTKGLKMCNYLEYRNFSSWQSYRFRLEFRWFSPRTPDATGG